MRLLRIRSVHAPYLFLADLRGAGSAEIKLSKVVDDLQIDRRVQLVLSTVTQPGAVVVPDGETSTLLAHVTIAVPRGDKSVGHFNGATGGDTTANGAIEIAVGKASLTSAAGALFVTMPVGGEYGERTALTEIVDEMKLSDASTTFLIGVYPLKGIDSICADPPKPAKYGNVDLYLSDEAYPQGHLLMLAGLADLRVVSAVMRRPKKLSLSPDGHLARGAGLALGVPDVMQWLRACTEKVQGPPDDAGSDGCEWTDASASSWCR